MTALVEPELRAPSLKQVKEVCANLNKAAIVTGIAFLGLQIIVELLKTWRYMEFVSVFESLFNLAISTGVSITVCAVAIMVQRVLLSKWSDRQKQLIQMGKVVEVKIIGSQMGHMDGDLGIREWDLKMVLNIAFSIMKFMQNWVPTYSFQFEVVLPNGRKFKRYQHWMYREQQPLKFEADKSYAFVDPRKPENSRLIFG